MFNGGNASCYSLSDIAAVTGGYGGRTDGGMFGDDNGWWIILLFLLFGWGNGNGFGNGNGTVREEISYGFDMNGLESSVRGIQQGLCDGFYSQNSTMLQGFNGLNTAISSGIADIQQTLCQGFNGVNTGMLTGFNGIQAQMANDALVAQQCCCDTQNLINSKFCDLNYNIATQSCDTRRAITDSARDIIDAQHDGTRQILDFLTQDKIASLQAENQTLKFAASQQAQNNYLVGALKDPCPIPAYVVPNPNCCYPYAAVSFANACGCGC